MSIKNIIIQSAFLLCVLLFLFMAIFFQIIPFIYTITLLLITILIYILVHLLNYYRPNKYTAFFKELVIILFIILYLITSFSLYRLHALSKAITKNDGDVVVLSALEENNDKIESIMGIYNMDIQIISQVLKTTHINKFEVFPSIALLSQALIDKKITHVGISASDYALLSELNYLKTSLSNIEYVSLNLDSNVLDNSFNILISGTDSLASPSINNRSDMNMLISVNLNTMQILLTSIPRDFYIKNTCLNNRYDKLCHVSNISMNCLINSINTFIDSNIDYYARISFSSVINIIDILKGLEINVPFTFKEYDEYKNKTIYLHKGVQTLNGKQVLALARHRKTLPNGDFDRNRSQQLIINALLKKASKLENIFLINNFFEIIEKNVYTNLSIDDFYYLLSYVNVLDDFKLITQNITGNYANMETASLNGYKLSVVLMDKNKLAKNNKKINTVLESLNLQDIHFNINNLTY